MDDRFHFSEEAESFRRGFTDLESYGQLISDHHKIYTDPSVDNMDIFDHPEGRVAWTPLFRIVFSTGDALFIRSISRRGPTPRLDEPFDLV